MTTIIYTCITGNYDTLKDIKTNNRAICFTDIDLKSDTWQIIKIDFRPKIFRKIKICPHLFLPEHDRNVWIDGNLAIEDIDKLIESRSGFETLMHTKRYCIYQEAVRCIEIGKDKEETIMRQVNKYYNEGYPFSNGLIWSALLIRDNTEENRDFGNLWWNEVRRYSVRDQLSFNYVAWKTGLKYRTFYPGKGLTAVTHTNK